MIAFNDVKNAKYIVIITDNNSFANANALYSYILSEHKKVSLVATEEIDAKFSFLPWYEKRRKNIPSSADMTITVKSDTISLFHYLKEHGISINQKMATALFAGLLESSEGFSSDKCNGMIFAAASELIALKAEYVTCKEFLQKRDSLALFRLKSLIYKNMVQSADAQVVKMYISNEDLKSTGATQRDVEKVQKELLNIVHVREVILYKSDENNKILKSIKEI